MKQNDAIIIFSGATDCPTWITNFSETEFLQELCFAFTVHTLLAKNLVCYLTVLIMM